jgi:hypothetical protein
VADLLFKSPQTGSTDLVFGADEVVVGTAINVSLVGTLPPLEFAAEVGPVLSLSLVGTLPTMTVALAVNYFSNAARPTVGQVQGPWQIAAHASQNAEQAHQDSPPSPAAWIARWQDAARTPAGVEHLLPSGFDRTNRPDITGPFQDASGLHDSAQFAHQDATRTRLGLIALFKDGTGARDDTLFKHQDGTRTHGRRETSQQQATPRPLVRSPDRHQVASALLRAWQTAFEDGVPPPPGLSVLPVFVPPPPPPCYLLSTALLFEALAAADGGLVFRCDAGAVGPIDPDPPPGQIIIPIRSVYMTVNTITLTRVDGNIPMRASAFSMSFDVDSWTGPWSATVPLSAASLLSPAHGEPTELEVVINSVPYRLLVEEISSTRKFGESVLSISGRGLAATLDSPYAQTRNFSAANDRSAQQLATEALQINGVGIGWSVDWQIEDWNVPGGVWSHQGSHISAVNAIAAAVGGYVQPHPTSKTLRVLHRYPQAPWNWASVSPDIILPSAPVLVEGIRWASKADYNQVHVSGTTDSGFLGQVRRTGTAGGVEAPMVVEPLITAPEAARQRGRAVISDTGRQALVSLSLPLLPETGLIMPGKFLQYTDGGSTRRGIVRSSALSWQRPRMRQDITLETHETA